MKTMLTKDIKLPKVEAITAIEAKQKSLETRKRLAEEYIPTIYNSVNIKMKRRTEKTGEMCCVIDCNWVLSICEDEILPKLDEVKSYYTSLGYNVSVNFVDHNGYYKFARVKLDWSEA